MSPLQTLVLSLVVMLLLATLQLSSVAADSPALHTYDSSRHRREAESKVDLDALKDNLASIEDGLSTFQKRSCAVGLNSHHCAIAHLDDIMSGSDYLSGGFSPGKRNTVLPRDVRTRVDILLDNLKEQMQAIGIIRHLLNQISRPVKPEEKRTCAFRLANHCLTEALDRAASQYYYLHSPLSPGRRRREVRPQESSAVAQTAANREGRQHLRLFSDVRDRR